MSRLRSRCPHSTSDWRLICLRSHFPHISWIFNWSSWTLTIFSSGLSSSFYYLGHYKNWDGLFDWLIDDIDVTMACQNNYCSAVNCYKSRKNCLCESFFWFLICVANVSVDLSVLNQTTASPVAAAHTWNSLCHVRTLCLVFRGRLKAFIFRRSFPWLLPQLL